MVIRGSARAIPSTRYPPSASATASTCGPRGAPHRRAQPETCTRPAAGGPARSRRGCRRGRRRAPSRSPAGRRRRSRRRPARARRPARRRRARRRSTLRVGQHDGAPGRDDGGGPGVGEEAGLAAVSSPSSGATTSAVPPSARGTGPGTRCMVAEGHVSGAPPSCNVAFATRARQRGGDPRRRRPPAPPPATPCRRPPRATPGTPPPRPAAPPRRPRPARPAPVSTPATSSATGRAPAQVRILRRDVAAAVVEREQEPSRQLRPAPGGRTARGPAPPRAPGRRPGPRRSPTAATPGRCAPARASPTAAVRRRSGARTSAGDRDSPRSCRFPREVRCTRPSPSSSAQSATRPQRRRRRSPRRAAGSGRARRRRRRAARRRPGRRRRGIGRRRAPGHSKHGQRAALAAPTATRAVARLDASPGHVRQLAGATYRQVHIASGGQEAGASPARSRHRHRALRLAEPDTAPPAAMTRDEDPEEGPPCAARRSGSRPGDPAAVHLGHRPALGPRLAAPPGAPPTRTASRRPAGPARRARTSSSSASSAGAGTGRTGSTRVLASGEPVVALGGEQAPDAEMMELSTVPAGRRGRGAHLPRAGRPGEPRAAARLPLRHRAAHRRGLRAAGRAAELGRPRARRARPTDGPTVAVLYYRAQQLAGNTALRRGALRRDRGRRRRRPLPVFCASLRQAEPALLQTLRAADAMVVTVLAAGGTKPADASAGGDDEAWDVAELAALDVPILQGLCLTSSRATWAANDDGLSPLDVATQVAVPGVRRPADHGAVLVQGVRRRRAVDLRPRPRARRPRRRHRRAARPAAAHPERGQADRADAVGVPDQARADRQRRRARHPGQRGRPAHGDGGGRLRRRGDASRASPSRTATR